MARYLNIDDFYQDHEPLLTWELIDAMNKSATEDVRQEKHAKWMNYGDFFVCSKCAMVANVLVITEEKYCTRCGARMDG